MSENAKKTLFVLSGGGMPGLDIHAGIWRALEDHGIVATDLSGTSAGAIVAAANSAGWSAASFDEFLRCHDDDSVRHERPFWKIRAPWLESVHDSDRILAVLEGMLPVTWDKYRKPIHVWACKRRNGERVNVAREENVPALAILASMSICGIFPAVTLADGEAYIDGGPRFNLPLLPNWREYDEVWLIIGRTRPQDYKGGGIVSNLVRNAGIMALDQIQDVLEEAAGAPHVRVIWPELECDKSMLRFDHELIDQVYWNTVLILDKKGWV